MSRTAFGFLRKNEREGRVAEPRARELLSDAATLEGIEAAAARFAGRAGELVMARFGGRFGVDYKDEAGADPVTEVDRAVEECMARAIARRFPAHGVLGEEGQEPEGEPEYEWVVDPIDGTRNFVGVLPLFAVSVGVLHCRRPVVGVMVLPASGETLRARHGGGAHGGVGEPLRAAPQPGLHPGLLAALPNGFPAGFKVGREVRHRLGAGRHLGSVSYEMGLVASGALGYAVLQDVAAWDVAAGVTLVREAGGLVLRHDRRSGGWFPLESFRVPGPRDGEYSRALRDWNEPIIAGGRAVVGELARHLSPLPRGVENS